MREISMAVRSIKIAPPCFILPPRGPKTRARSCIVTFHSKSSADVGQTVVLFSFSTGRKPVYIDIPPNVDFEIVDIFRCGLLSIVSIHLYFFK